MATKTTAIPQGYLKLIKTFRLRPIRSDEELDAATNLVNELIMRKDLTEDEQDYLDVLTNQIEAYEDVHYPITGKTITPSSMLRFLIEQKGVTQTEVGKATGFAVSTVSEILSEKREIGRKHLEAFAKYFSVDPRVFLKRKE